MAFRVEKANELKKEEILNFLKKHNKMVLAYINQAAEPVQNFMLYAVDDNFNIYFGTLKRFKKYEYLISNPPLSIFIEEESKDPEKAASIKAVIVELYDSKEEIKEKLDWFEKQNPCKYHIKDEEDFVLFQAKILSVRFVDGSGDTIVRYDLDLE